MNKETPDCVFVVGSSRSGTSLLYNVLLASDKFAIYDAETWLLEKGPIKYGDLNKQANFDSFMEDWLSSEQFKRSRLDRKSFVGKLHGRKLSYGIVLRTFMDEMTTVQGKASWVEKTPSHVFHIKKLATELPDSKFIHIIRDGRDVALSKRKLGWSGVGSQDALSQLVWAAKSWEYAVKQGRKMGKRLNKRYAEIHYEKIVLDLPTALDTLNAFLGTNTSEKTLKDCGFGVLGRNNSAFGRGQIGIASSALSRWKTDLSDTETAVLNIAIGKTLQVLGYEVPTSSSKLGVWMQIKAIWWCSVCPIVLRLRRFIKSKTILGRHMTTGYEVFRAR